MKTRFGLLGLCLAFLTSCATLTLDDVGRLHKNMTVDDAKAMLPVKPAHSFDVDGGFEFLVYTLKSGDYASQYFLAFRNGVLVFWGYPQEFARSSDETLNHVGAQAVEKEKVLEASDKTDLPSSPR